MKPTNSVLADYGVTIFAVMSAMANEHGAINLGQGMPDADGPEDIREFAAKAGIEGPNQYPPTFGVPELREAVAAHEQRFYGLKVDAASQTLITSGATEALAACELGLLDPGDEVVLIEPVYDTYRPMAELAGATTRVVRLQPPDWALPLDELRAAFSEKTKLLMLNTPMNPVGKIFAPEELEAIAALLNEFDAYAICDEVYEHLVFPGERHVPLIGYPGMMDRVLRIGSAGKTFSLTGWKVGYVVSSAELIARVAKAHQFLVFTTPPALQKAVAYGLGKDDAFFEGIGADLARKCELLADGLTQAGFNVLPCQAGYFLCADFSGLGFNGGDAEFCEHITKEAGVAAIPVSAFYGGDPVETVARFCFCKSEDSLKEAVERLKAHFA